MSGKKGSKIELPKIGLHKIKNSEGNCGIKRSIGFHKIREERFLPSTLLKRG